MRRAKMLGVMIASAGLALSACSDADGDTTGGDTAGEARDMIGSTLAEAIADTDRLSIMADAMTRTGLVGVLEGEASYTVLAPTDAAFEEASEQLAQAMGSEADGAIAAAVLREHIVPGALDPASIREAIKNSGGEATIANFGAGTITFSLDGDTIVARSGEGPEASATSDVIITTNGVLIPVDAVLINADSIPG